MAAGVMAPGRKRRPARRRDPGRRRAHGAELSGQRLEGGLHVVFEAGQLGGPGILRHQQAGLVRIGEERDGLARAHQHQVAGLAHHTQRLLDDIGNALDLDAAGAALQPGIGAFGQDPAAGLGRDPPGQLQTGLAQGIAAHQQRCSLAAAQHGGGRLDGIVRDLCAELPEVPSRRCHRPRPRPCRPAGSGWRSGRASAAPPAIAKAPSAAMRAGSWARSSPNATWAPPRPSMSEVSGAS